VKRKSTTIFTAAAGAENPPSMEYRPGPESLGASFAAGRTAAADEQLKVVEVLDVMVTFVPAAACSGSGATEENPPDTQATDNSQGTA
jgi:hypothetical protein